MEASYEFAAGFCMKALCRNVSFIPERGEIVVFDFRKIKLVF